jgi:tetratricopeptide (TPR) repeat protein
MSEPVQSAVETVAQVDGLIERRRVAQARTLLERSLAQHPEHVELLLRGALLDHLQDDEEAARRTLQSVLAKEPDHAGARRLLFSVLLELGHLEEAEQVILGLLHDHPESPPLFASYALLMLRTLHLDKAQRLAREGLRLDPEDAECLFALALCELVESPSDNASAALPELLHQSPEHAQTLWLLSASLRQQGRLRAALRVAQELLRSEPDSPPYLALVRELRLATHWSLLPLYPMLRWGWAGSALVWGGAVLMLAVARRLPPVAAATLLVLWLAYVIYSWTWPALLRRRLARD